MSSSGKKPKKKYRPLPIDTILINTVVRPSTTSWAEEVESELTQGSSLKKKINLPTAPRAVCDLVIDESKIPANGPFVAYLSNLPYEITEEDIERHFKDLKIEEIKLPRDRQDRMRGFGYVEFKDKSSLLIALQEGELTLNERLVRISLPNDDDQKDKGSRSSGSAFGRNRDMSDRFEKSDKPVEWRAAAPIPHDPDKSVTKHTGGFTRLTNHRDRDRDGPSGGGPFRESRSGFGSDFDKSGPSFSRAFKERDDRDMGRSSERGGGGSRMFNKRFDREDRGSRSSLFGKKFDRDDRDREFKREPVASEKEEPRSRPRIELQPRSVPIDTNSAPATLPSSIFGGAKPVDTAKREMEIEMKIEMKLSTLSSGSASVRAHGPSSVASTPTQNRSRSSSISSVSGGSSRKREAEPTERSDDITTKSNGPADQQKNESSNSRPTEKEEAKLQEFKEPLPPPANYWKQRSEASAVASCIDQQTSTMSHSAVIDTSVETDEKASVVAATAAEKETRRQAEIDSSTVHQETVAVDGDSTQAEARNSFRASAEKSHESSSKWTTYSSDSYDSNQQHSGRYGSGGSGGRFSENSKFGSFGGRDNRRDTRKESRRDGDRRSDNRYFKNRDDNYGSGRPDSGSHQNKWDRSSKNGGPFRNKNNGSGPAAAGPRSYDRQDYSDRRNDNYSSSAAASNRSSGSSINNLRDDNEFSRDGYREERRFNDERLTEHGGANVDNAAATKDGKSSDSLDDRLKTSVGDDFLSPENGNEDGDGKIVSLSTENSKNSTERPELNDNTFSSGKSRKKDKKKKTVDRNDELNEKEILKPIENERKLNNQKEEKKKPLDNHQTNDKSSSVNNAKAKDNRSKKNAKKSKEARDDVTQLPKQKEEKTPIFQDSNRYQLLGNDE